jgi:hypothetical protein
MPGLRDLLIRFRPAGAPGPPTPGGVPADRVAEASAELAPVFALLADTEAEALRIRGEGVARAEQIRQDAARQSSALVEASQANSGSVRAETAARIRAAGTAESAALIANAEHVADDIRRTAEKDTAERSVRLIGAIAAELRGETAGDLLRTPTSRLPDPTAEASP